MPGSEKRLDARASFQVPIRFRPITNPTPDEYFGESVNVSQRGVCMATRFPLEVGTEIAVAMRMPKELVGTVEGEIHCVARVVHVQTDTFLSGSMRVGLRIERYEPLKRRERWAN